MSPGTPRQPWPRSVVFAGMLIFGAVAAALRTGIAAEVALGAIAAAMALGRP